MVCPVASAGICMHLQITGVSWSRIDIPFLFPPNVVVRPSRLTNWASCDQSNCKCRPISGAAGCPFINWRHLSCLSMKAFFCGWHWQANIMHPFWTSTRCTHVTAVGPFHLSFLKLPQRCLVLVWFFSVLWSLQPLRTSNCRDRQPFHYIVQIPGDVGSSCWLPRDVYPLLKWSNSEVIAQKAPAESVKSIQAQIFAEKMGGNLILLVWENIFGVMLCGKTM